MTDAAADQTTLLKTNEQPPAATVQGNRRRRDQDAEGKDEKTYQPLVASRYDLSENIARRHAVSPEAGVPLGALLKPSFWSNVAHQLRDTDIIEVRAEDGTYYAELYVWSKGKAFANVSVINAIERPQTMLMKAVEGFDVEFRAGPTKFRVVRVTDAKEIKSGFETADAATDWLIANRRQYEA
ncbi:MAG: hypothetical protein V4673_14545 [Pseudomonadota bacterium]